ncbi:MAG TPA: hypothetical protein DC017_11010 [Candidatus Wallbacteria bacterium]|nr:hypothetical protein [Candidatus Wallbacteria bacterium]
MTSIKGAAMEAKKIRFTVPQYIADAVKRDIESFGLTLNGLCNLIFERYKKPREAKVERSCYNKIIQFNLNAKNMTDYEHYWLNFDNEAEYFRNILTIYANLPRYKRQLFVFDDVCRKINTAVKKRRVVEIKYKGAVSEVEPYLLAHSKEEACNYMFCYSLKHEKFLNYKIPHLEDLNITEKEYTPRDENYVNSVRDDFDAFLSSGKTVTVRLSEAGLAQFEKAAHLRPGVLKKEGNVFTLECSEPRAKIYFPKFLGEAEILGPPKLRSWFAEKFKKACALYEK